eukprot:COSAG01_NODE_62361_length_285_cov_0.575269_1_plen_53_part_10
MRTMPTVVFIVTLRHPASEASLFNFGDDKFNTTYISTDDLDIIGDSLDDIKEI